MKDGDILCLENTRFHAGEEKNDPGFARKLAALGDVYVDDAFSAAHREHASNAAIVTSSSLPAYAGRAMQAELEALHKALETPEHPVAAIVGGAKISTKLDLLGQSAGESRDADHRRRHGQHLPRRAGQDHRQVAVRARPRPHARATSWPRRKALSCEIVLPVDAVVAQKFAAHAPSRVVAVDDSRRRRHDPRHRPAQRSRTSSPCSARAKTLVWNGPFGAFELRALR